MTPAPLADRRRIRVALAMLSMAAGLAHAAVAGEHAAVVWWYGMAFGAVAVLQLTWGSALLMRQPTRSVLLVGAAGHAMVLGAWVTAQTIGLPLVASPQPSSVGLLDGATAVFEAQIVAGVVLAGRRSVWLRPNLARSIRMAARVATVVAVPVITAALLVGPPHEHSHADADADTHADGLDEHAEPHTPRRHHPAAAR